MGRTQLTTRELGANSVNRDDLDTTTTTKAVVAKLVAGTNVSISSTGVDTGTGDVTINGPTTSLVLTGVASPTYASGKLVFDTDNDSLTFFNSDSSIGLQVGQEEWIRVKNVSGSTIANGKVVYISGANSGYPTIALAKGDAAATVVSIGLTTESIANNAVGMVTVIGVVHGLDTSGFSAGAIVYVDPTTAGSLTSTAPTAPNYRMRVGMVCVSDATVGSIHVTPSTAALGNGTANQVIGINAAGTAQEQKSFANGTGISVVHTANTITINATGSSLTKTNITGASATLVADTVNTVNTATSAVPLLLPAAAAVGTIIKVIGSSTGGWKITQNASQIVHVGNLDTLTGTGGSIQSTNRYDSIELTCVVANLEWTASAIVGNLTVTYS